MRILLALLACLLLAGFAHADPKKSACQCVVDGKCSCGPTCDCGSLKVSLKSDDGGWKNYFSAFNKAVKENKVLVVGVGCEPVVPTGCLGVRCDAMEGGNGLWICFPQRDGGLKASFLTTKASVTDVKNVINPPPVVLYSSPVSSSFGRSC